MPLDLKIYLNKLKCISVQLSWDLAGAQTWAGVGAYPAGGLLLSTGTSTNTNKAETEMVINTWLCGCVLVTGSTLLQAYKSLSYTKH